MACRPVGELESGALSSSSDSEDSSSRGGESRASLGFDEGTDSSVVKDELDALQGVVKLEVNLAHSQSFSSMSLHVLFRWPTERFAFSSVVANSCNPFKFGLVSGGDLRWAQRHRSSSNRGRWGWSLGVVVNRLGASILGLSSTTRLTVN